LEHFTIWRFNNCGQLAQIVIPSVHMRFDLDLSLRAGGLTIYTNYNCYIVTLAS